MSELEYTEEEVEQEAERLRVREALDKLTLVDLAAYFKSRDARKREFHAMNYSMGPTKFKYVGCKTYRLRVDTPNCSSLTGSYTEWERTRDLVLKHFLAVPPSVGLGIAIGYDRQSEHKFLSFPIEYAVKKTIEEHYETRKT